MLAKLYFILLVLKVGHILSIFILIISQFSIYFTKYANFLHMKLTIIVSYYNAYQSNINVNILNLNEKC